MCKRAGQHPFLGELIALYLGALHPRASPERALYQYITARYRFLPKAWVVISLYHMESEGSDHEVEVIDVDEEDFKVRCEKAKMPPDLPQRYQAFWLKFSEAPPPVCEYHSATMDAPEGFYLISVYHPPTPPFTCPAEELYLISEGRGGAGRQRQIVLYLISIRARAPI